MTNMKRKHPSITALITTAALLVSMCASLTFSQRTSAHADPLTNKKGTNEYPVLSQHATDLTKLARAGKLESSQDHEADVSRFIASLTSAARNPVVVSESDLDR